MRALSALLVLVLGCPVEPPPEPFCGDGALDSGEACDDGNNADADGCNADCSLPACENGILDPGEVCLVGPVDAVVDRGPISLLAADFNGDSALDLATSNGVGESLSLLLGDGLGTFSRGVDVPLLGAGVPLVAGDFNGDGALDLATSLLTGPDLVPVLRGDGTGGFSQLVALTVGPSSGSLAVGDFNGDGALDLVADDGPGGGVVLFPNSGEGGFIAPVSLSSGVVFSVASGDFNGDGALDVVAGVPAGLEVLLGDGAGGFEAELLEVGTTSRLVATDFNADEALDLVGVINGSVILFLGLGEGLFSTAVQLPLLGAVGVVVGDFNGDGALDLAASSGVEPVSKSAHFTLFLSDGAGAFEALPAVSLGFSDPQGLAAGDFNGDGQLDLAISDTSSERLQIFFSTP